MQLLLRNYRILLSLSANTFNCFESINTLDKHWSDLCRIYDFHAKIQGDKNHKCLNKYDYFHLQQDKSICYNSEKELCICFNNKRSK